MKVRETFGHSHVTVAVMLQFSAQLSIHTQNGDRKGAWKLNWIIHLTFIMESLNEFSLKNAVCSEKFKKRDLFEYTVIFSFAPFYRK